MSHITWMTLLLLILSQVAAQTKRINKGTLNHADWIGEQSAYRNLKKNIKKFSDLDGINRSFHAKDLKKRMREGFLVKKVGLQPRALHQGAIHIKCHQHSVRHPCFSATNRKTFRTRGKQNPAPKSFLFFFSFLLQQRSALLLASSSSFFFLLLNNRNPNPKVQLKSTQNYLEN